MEKIEYLDYSILFQLVISILYSIFSYNKYELIIVYFSAVLFISYWLTRIVFSNKYKPN
jgi:hypothetical protein